MSEDAGQVGVYCRSLQPPLLSHIPLSSRQQRLAHSGHPGLAGQFTGASVRVPALWSTSECSGALQNVCSRIDSLRARIVHVDNELQWSLDADEPTSSAIEVHTSATRLEGFLDELALSHDWIHPLAPVVFANGGCLADGACHGAKRTWFLAVGAARCDRAGLEQLIQYWVEVIERSDRKRVYTPGLATVQRALSRAAESTEASSARTYWQRHLDSHDGSFERSPGVRRPGIRAAFAPQPLRIGGVDALLAQIADRYATSSRTLLCAAWILLLGRIIDSARPTVWLQLNGRVALELRQYVGHLSQLVPLTRHLDSQEPIATFVRDVDRALTMHHRLQDSYGLPTSEENTEPVPSADLQFAFHVSKEVAEPVTIADAREGSEPFLLRLNVDCARDEHDVTLLFDASAIRPVQAEYAAQRFARILHTMRDPSASLRTVCLPPADLISPVLQTDCGASCQEWITEDRLSERVSAGLQGCNVLQTEEAGVGKAFGLRVTRRVESLRLHCSRQRGSSIALVAPNSIEAAVTTVAAVLAGIAVAFTDPDWPATRRRMAIEQVGAALVIGTRAGVADLALEVPRLSFEQLAQEESTSTATWVEWDTPLLDEIAYIVFSSGSTGEPKPIMVNRRALQNQLLWLKDRLPLRPADVVLHRSPLGFDAAVWELLHAVCSAATVVIPSHATANDPHAILRDVERYSITVLQLTPQLLSAIDRDPDLHRLNSVRFLVSGGDKLPHKLAQSVLAGTHLALFNAYGPSECCIQVSMGEVVTNKLPAPASSVSVGLAMPNVGMHILTRDGEPLLDGHVGHLYISGAALACGYAGEAGATAHKFVPMVCSPMPGARMYDTGDLARRLPGGDLEILGRVDTEIKLNGVRVDVLAIETKLREIGSVQDVAVVAVRDEYGAGYLAAVIATAAGAAEVIDAARRLLGDSLSSTAQPAHYICLPRLPLTARGKIDRDAIVQLAVSAAARPSEPPRTPLEETIASVWCSVLKREKIGVHDDFFLTGGHSLLFAQVIVRLRTALGLEISLRAVFMHPTIALLAEHIESLQREGRRREPDAVPVHP